MALSGAYLGLFLANIQQPDYAVLVLLILVSLVLVLQAAIIPSTARRTLVVGALAVACALVGSIPIASSAPPFKHLWIGLLGAAFITVTVVTSPVIYGLQRQVHSARQLGQ